MNILWIKDNNIGHEKQAKILLMNYQKLAILISYINIKGFHPFFTYVDPVEENFFDLIIGAGHKTYSYILDIKNLKKSCKTVAILTPTFKKISLILFVLHLMIKINIQTQTMLFFLKDL